MGGGGGEEIPYDEIHESNVKFTNNEKLQYYFRQHNGELFIIALPSYCTRVRLPRTICIRRPVLEGKVGGRIGGSSNGWREKRAGVRINYIPAAKLFGRSADPVRSAFGGRPQRYGPSSRARARRKQRRGCGQQRPADGPRWRARPVRGATGRTGRRAGPRRGGTTVKRVFRTVILTGRGVTLSSVSVIVNPSRPYKNADRFFFLHFCRLYPPR